MARFPLGFLLPVAAALLLQFPVQLAGQSLDLDRGRADDMLKVVAEDIEKHFYDPNLKGLDWKALVNQAHERIQRANAPGEMFTAIFALVDKLQDSHTFFIPPERSSRARFGFEAKPFGDQIRIYKVTKKGAAEKSGLKLGDQIVAVNRFRAERPSFYRMMLYFHYLLPTLVLDIVYRRGNQPERALRLEGKVIEREIVRDLTSSWGINDFIREVVAQRSEEEKPRSEIYENGTGYLRIPSFSVDEAGLDRAIRKVSSSRALIVDLRGNLGGARDLMCRTVGFFEPDPLVLAEEQERKKREPLKVKPQHPTMQMPLFILVDSETASAGEIFARHFQLTKRGAVIGDETSGRVNTARFYTHHSGVDVIVPYAAEVAVARFILPGGEELEGKGVTPDQRCIPTEDDLREELDPCLDLAKSLAQKAAVSPGSPPHKGNPPTP